MASGKRPGQVGDLVRAELAALIQREVRDPKVGFVTVTGVKLSPDLRHARVYISALEEEREAEAIEALQRAAGFLRRELAKRSRPASPGPAWKAGSAGPAACHPRPALPSDPATARPAARTRR